MRDPRLPVQHVSLLYATDVVQGIGRVHYSLEQSVVVAGDDEKDVEHWTDLGTVTFFYLLHYKDVIFWFPSKY